MKTCPECGTQYEDHVVTCLVDGADLANVPSAAPTPTPPSTGVGAAPAPAPSSNGGGMVVALVGIVVLLLMFAGVAGLLLVVLYPDDPPPPKPAPEKPATPVPVPVPTPVPVPVPLPPPKDDAPTISFTSKPEGAEVWEGNTKLCASTPCKIPHPEHAPLPREFVVKKAGYLEKTYEMSDPSEPHVAPLSAIQRQPAPKPGPQLPKIETER